MGYLNHDVGMIGQYKGKEVILVDYKTLTEEQKRDKERIYAVRCRGNDRLEMVYMGELIGLISDGGSVDYYQEGHRNRRPYRFPTAPKPVVEAEVAPEVKVDIPLNLTNPFEVTEIDYSNYSRIVDDFFAALEV